MLLSKRRRAGFTLLEVLVASAISVLLLGALYVAFDLTLKQTDAGREAVQRGDIARAVANRINIDLACCIGPMPPRSGGGIPEDTTAAATTGTTTSTTTTTTTSTDTALGVATGTTDLAESEGKAAVDLPFQGGLFGSENQVTLFVSKVPPALAEPTNPNAVADPRADLRRVTYYFVAGKGLCRQEQPWVTADGVRNSADPLADEKGTDLLSEDVKSVTFSYFDGSAWASSWTGSDAMTDGKSVKGPPRAIKITMTIQPPGVETSKTVVYTVMIRAAVGLSVPPVAEEEIDPAVLTQ